MNKLNEEILAKFLMGECTEDELREVNAWLEESGENARELFRLEEIYHLGRLGDTSNTQDIEKAEKRLFKRLEQEKTKQYKVRRMVGWMRYAAVFVGFFLLGTFGYLFYQTYSQPETLLAVTTHDKIKELKLPDGTKVWLNSESTLSYRSDFGRRDRDVELDGEAYFEVAKNKEIPFYVNTETNQVRVVGTHFNVCAYKGSNEFETTLVEGIVDIYAYDNERPLTRLTKNEFFGSYQGKYKKAVLPSYDYLRWREGLYCFDDSPFSCILTKLEKYYNVKITVENPKVLNYRCTGKFKEQDGVEHILKVIQKDHPFTYSISEEGDSIRIE